MKIDGVRKTAAIIRMIAPEYKDKAKEELRSWIELAEPYISERKFGKLYYQALAYLTAHKMSLNMPETGQEDEVRISAKDAMNVASYTEGSTSISFNNSAASAGSTAGADAEYLLTTYGLQFLAIRKQCIVPICIAGMKRNTAD